MILRVAFSKHAFFNSLLSNVVAIAAGWIRSHALLSDSTVITWGTQMEMDGREIRAAAKLSNIVSIAGWGSLGARSDGSLVNILNGESYSGISNIVAVAFGVPIGGRGHLVALQRDGSVVGIQLTTPPALSLVMSNATAIAAGGWQNLALKRDGTVFAWGRRDSHVPPGLSNVVAISAGQNHSLALKSDGTVAAWGATERFAESVPAGLSNVVAIAAGNDFSLAITTDPEVADRFRR
ncbi:MAG: hypothetical protein KJ070_25770 [Verrucomicrobia bacterium]|nr:hypothetical protein [Verrucomicrobiota bacterium]